MPRTRKTKPAPETQEPQAAQEPQVESQPQTIDEAVLQVAQAIGEDATSFTRHKDIGQVLEMMGQGVIVRLTIERPRFVTRLSPEDLGLDSGGETGEVLKNYFQLGNRSLLPKPLQDELNRAEMNARYSLERYSIDSYWGHFVPVTRYQDWKAANAEQREKFLALRDRVVSEYERLVQEVEAAYRKAAEDVWKRQLWQRVSARLNLEPGEQAGREAVRQALRELNVTARNRDEFVEGYTRQVMAPMPSSENVAARFVYRTELSYIPLPSVLARDVETADRVYQERARENAAHQAEIARLRALEQEAEAEAWAAKERAEAEVWAAREAERARYALERKVLEATAAAELEKLRRQQEMEADVLAEARAQKEKLVSEFYGGVVGKINQLLFEVCDNASASIEKNQGRMGGSISMQLKNLVEQLEGWNFTGDVQVERQIARLKSILAVQVADAPKARPEKLDTAYINRVLAQLRSEAEATLIELGHAPVRRAERQAAFAGDAVEALLEEAPRRKRRASVQMPLVGDEAASGAKRRRARE